MRLRHEAELVQNHSLGATLQWDFAYEFYKQAGRQSGPQLPLFLPVLPITMHQDSVEQLHRRQFSGGLHLALAENRTLVVDLQERIETMADATMKSLNICFGSGALAYDASTGEVKPLSSPAKVPTTTDEVKAMRHTARRLGHWFHAIGLEQLCSLLRIRF